MGRRLKPKYTRCKVCRELVVDADNCANCRDRSPSYSRRRIISGKRGAVTLDQQEGNPSGERS